MDKIITRFAPSPTGELHIGGARTALFEYLFAKHVGGDFLLRIEDTDRGRFVEGSPERIVESLRWLGILPDNLENVMVQSERLDIYKKYAFQLVDEDKAYICTCSKEKLDADRKRQEEQKQPTGYAGTCREANIRLEDVKDGNYVIRMKIPKDQLIVIDDLIRGAIQFNPQLLDDQVILKSDGYPTYHLASVIDDHEMGINAVIRAEEWLSSTPKHIILYRMFGWKPPQFAHLPMVLAPDRTKLSKRHGATSVVEYKNLGYLPEAVVNFIAFQGWNPGDEREFFTLPELEKEFSIEKVNKAPAIFNIDKLNNINQHYLLEKMTKYPSEMAKLLDDFGLASPSDGEMELLGRGGFKTLKEMADYIIELRCEPKYDAAILIFKKSTFDATLTGLTLALQKLQSAKQFDSKTIQQLLSEIVDEAKLTNGDVFWPVRVALSGQEKSPSPVELAVALGKDAVLKRLTVAIDILQKTKHQLPE